MINENSACTDLMTDIVFIAQRSNTETCDIAARTIARQALNFVKIFPQKVKNVQTFQDLIRDLCECLLQLKNEVSGTGEEILIKRDALDILLLISGALIYPKIETDNDYDEEEFAPAQLALT